MQSSAGRLTHTAATLLYCWIRPDRRLQLWLHHRPACRPSAVSRCKRSLTKPSTSGNGIPGRRRGRPVCLQPEIPGFPADRAFLPNIPPQLTLAEFWKLVKFSWFHSLSGCALVCSPPPSLPPPLCQNDIKQHLHRTHLVSKLTNKEEQFCPEAQNRIYLIN